MSYFKKSQLFLFFLLTSCQSYWPADPDLGSSVNKAITEQTSDPMASTKAPNNIYGMDGPSAKSSIDNYQNSFIKISPLVNNSSNNQSTASQNQSILPISVNSIGN